MKEQFMEVMKLIGFSVTVIGVIAVSLIITTLIVDNTVTKLLQSRKFLSKLSDERIRHLRDILREEARGRNITWTL